MEKESADFLGKTTSEKIYVNSANYLWIKLKELKNIKNIEWHVAPNDNM